MAWEVVGSAGGIECVDCRVWDLATAIDIAWAVMTRVM